MSSATPTDLLLRPAQAADVPEIVAVYLEARAAAPMPPPVFGPEVVREWLAVKVLAPRDGIEIWVAESAGSVVGFAAITPTWLDDLFVHPASQGQGVGSALIDLVKSLHPDGFGLYVFESNAPARAFYARHGLREVEISDGSRTQEGVPDVRMVFP